MRANKQAILSSFTTDGSDHPAVGASRFFASLLGRQELIDALPNLIPLLRTLAATADAPPARAAIVAAARSLLARDDVGDALKVLCVNFLSHHKGELLKSVLSLVMDLSEKRVDAIRGGLYEGLALLRPGEEGGGGGMALLTAANVPIFFKAIAESLVGLMGGLSKGLREDGRGGGGGGLAKKRLF
jgi:hypothetical protein